MITVLLAHRRTLCTDILLRGFFVSLKLGFVLHRVREGLRAGAERGAIDVCNVILVSDALMLLFRSSKHEHGIWYQVTGKLRHRIASFRGLHKHPKLRLLQ